MNRPLFIRAVLLIGLLAAVLVAGRAGLDSLADRPAELPTELPAERPGEPAAQQMVTAATTVTSSPTPTAATVAATATPLRPTATVLPTASPTPEPTAVYTNTTYGYSLHYPTFLHVLPDFGVATDSYFSTAADAASPLEMGQGDVWVTIRVDENNEGVSLLQWVRRFAGPPEEEQQLTVAGVPAVQQRFDLAVAGDPHGGYAFRTYFADEGRFYTMTALAYERDTLAQYEEAYQLMVNSFRFLPSRSSAAPTTGPHPDVEWIEYRNEEYGFALSYPADWSVAELPHKISFTYPGSAVALRILVQWADEDVVIQRTGVAAGDFVEREPVTFLGGTLSSVQLVYEGKTKYVFYNNAGVFERGNLLFALELASNRQPYEAGDIPAWMQATADRIVESVRWLE